MRTKRSENYLIISDLQIPFEAKNALPFCKKVQKDFDIPDDNCLCVGDEVDQYFGSLYGKDPNATHTPYSEIRETIDKMREWYEAFPKMLIAESNHGQRWAKKASEASIPAIMMRKYQEIIEAPKTWRWQREWLIKASRKPFLLVHGMGYSGMHSYRQMALDNGISTVHGHLHSSAGIAMINTRAQEIWGMNVGSLIDREAYAFHYGKDMKLKACLSIGVVLNGGTTPILIPYED